MVEKRLNLCKLFSVIWWHYLLSSLKFLSGIVCYSPPCSRVCLVSSFFSSSLCAFSNLAHASNGINYHQEAAKLRVFPYRFSLYDFPSDSESEEQRPSVSKKELKKVSPKPPFKKQFSGSGGGKKSTFSPTAVQQQPTVVAAAKIQSSKVKGNSEGRQSPESNSGNFPLDVIIAWLLPLGYLISVIYKISLKKSLWSGLVSILIYRLLVHQYLTFIYFP